MTDFRVEMFFNFYKLEYSLFNFYSNTSKSLYYQKTIEEFKYVRCIEENVLFKIHYTLLKDMLFCTNNFSIVD